MQSEYEQQQQHTQPASPIRPASTSDSTLEVNLHSPVSLDQQSVQQLHKQQQQQQQRMTMDARSSLSRSDTMSGGGGGGGVSTGIPGAAFNTTPIYDAQGSLVGLQAPVDGHPLEEYSMERSDPMGYMGVSPMYQYNMTSPQGGPMLPVEYLPYPTYNVNSSQQVYNPNYAPSQHQQATSQEQHYQQVLQQHQQHEQQKLLMGNAAVNGTSTIIRGLPKQQQRLAFDKCPTVCSLFAILCCPITLWCSLPALIYSTCAYTDYRAHDVERYQRKSDIARHLVITACVIGLLLCVTWAILAFFYYNIIIGTIHDMLRVINHRFAGT